MPFSEGNPGPGRPPGLKNKRTQLLEGLTRVYGKGAEIAFWEQAARAARGMTAKEAVDNGLLPEDAHLPCLHSFKMIADRLTPTLKPREVELPALGDGQALSEVELTERLVAQLIKSKDPALIEGVLAGECPKTVQSTSRASIGEDEAKDEQIHELEAKE